MSMLDPDMMLGNCGAGRRLRQHEVRSAPEQLGNAGRRNAEWTGIGLAEDGRRLLALLDVDEMSGQQSMLLKSGRVAGDAGARSRLRFGCTRTRCAAGAAARSRSRSTMLIASCTLIMRPRRGNTTAV